MLSISSGAYWPSAVPLEKWKNWAATCKRMKSEHSLTPYTKMNSKCIKDLNIKLLDTRVILDYKMSKAEHPLT